jgi:MoaA/NifB/PqqE/SkfB family radical SAM enzyme
MDKPKYCSLLWKHISNEPLGHVRTCCIARDRVPDDDGREVTLGQSSVKEIFHNDYYKKIRQDIREGKRPKNCEPCWQDERNGKKSKRELYNEIAVQRYGEIDYDSEPDLPEDFQLILSNTCNLKCRSCNPNYSSKWVKEAKDRKRPYIEETVKIGMNDQRSKFWTEMDSWLPSIRFLEVMGGDPLYMKEFRVFADKLMADGISKDLEISFSTNGTTVNRPFIEKMLNNFKSVGFNVSIDAAAQKRFDYLRHGASWKEVSDNLDWFHELLIDRGISIGITVTITALNVMYLAELHKIFAERWPQFIIFHNMANFPTWFNCNVFPEECKPEIVKTLEDPSNFRPEYQKEIMGIFHHVMTPRMQTTLPYGTSGEDTIEAEIEKRWFMFCKEIVAGDLYRDENFRESFPELFTILVKHRVFNYHTFEYNIKNIPDFGNLQAGTII